LCDLAGRQGVTGQPILERKKHSQPEDRVTDMTRQRAASIANVMLICLFAAGFTCLPASAKAEDVSGPWDLTVESRQGTATPVVIFKQDGERLAGTYRGRMGETPLQGTIRGNNIQFTVNLKFRDQDFVVTYTGTVDGSAMRGSVRFGDSSSGTWTARRRSGA
jgi:hypothetical protein